MKCTGRQDGREEVERESADDHGLHGISRKNCGDRPSAQRWHGRRVVDQKPIQQDLCGFAARCTLSDGMTMDSDNQPPDLTQASKLGSILREITISDSRSETS